MEPTLHLYIYIYNFYITIIHITKFVIFHTTTCFDLYLTIIRWLQLM
jgi:hypothetical protein